MKWFESWFDTPYYHLLYAHRNTAEAEAFIDKITAALQIPAGSALLDLACGKGRHSVYLHQKGYHVTGVDLSANSIKAAKHYSAPNLHFLEHDMRHPLPSRFQYIFSLFTSFGYFDTEEEDKQVLDSVKTMLLPGGIFLLDYLNAELVKQDLQACIPLETELDGIRFHIEKQTEGNRVVKKITIEDGGNFHHFSEQVRLYTQPDLATMMVESGLLPFAWYGSYQLDVYNPALSPRLIVAARRG